MTIGDKVDVVLGSTNGPRGTVQIGTDGYTAIPSIMTLGSGSISACLTNLVIGSRDGNTGCDCQLNAANVSTGRLEVSGQIVVGRGRNNTKGSVLTLGPAFVTSVGNSSNRAYIGVSDTAHAGQCLLTAGGTFTAHLRTLLIGSNTVSSATPVNGGILDLNGVTNGLLDVDGSVQLGIGFNYGEMRLPAIPAVAGVLLVGSSNAAYTTTRGTLIMTGTVFTVTNSVFLAGPTAANRGRILTTVAGAPAGLDLAANATLSVNSGIISNRFLNPSAFRPVYWGLRWAGDHTNELETLRIAGKLAWSTNDLTDPGLIGPVRIFLQDGVTYLGAPMLKKGGSLIFIR